MCMRSLHRYLALVMSVTLTRLVTPPPTPQQSPTEAYLRPSRTPPRPGRADKEERTHPNNPRSSSATTTPLSLSPTPLKQGRKQTPRDPANPTTHDNPQQRFSHSAPSHLLTQPRPAESRPTHPRPTQPRPTHPHPSLTK